MAAVASTSGDVYRDLGANHHMWTSAQVDENGFMSAVTRTASFTWFGGFTGGAKVAVLGKDDIVIALSAEFTCGVNGTAWGNSDRTIAWNHQFGVGEVNGAQRLAVVQYWAPTWRLFEPLVQVGKVIYHVFSS